MHSNRNPSSHRPRAVGGLSSREQMRLLVFFLLGAVLVLISLATGSRSDDSEADLYRPEDRAEEEGETAGLVGGAPLRTWEAPPLEPLLSGEELDGVKSRPLAFGRLFRAVHAFPHHSFRRAATSSEGGGYRIVGGELLVDPDTARAFRGQPIEVLGVMKERRQRRLAECSEVKGQGTAVEEERREDVDELPLPPRVWDGVIETDGGHRIAFIGASNEVNPAVVSRRTRLQGVFFRVRQRDLGEGVFAAEGVVIAKRAVPLVPFQLRDNLPLQYTALLSRVPTEDTPHFVKETEDEALYDIAGFLLKHGEQHLAENPPELLEGTDPVKKPERYALRTVRAMGEVVYVRREPFGFPEGRAEDAPEGLRAFWHVIVARKIELNTPVSIFWFGETWPEEMREGAEIEIDGVFYRVNTHRARNGRVVPMPAMVATQLPRRAPVSEEMDITGYLLVFIGVGLLLAGGLLLVMRRDRRSSRALEEKLRKARVAREHERWRARGGEEGAGPDAPGSTPEEPRAPDSERR